MRTPSDAGKRPAEVACRFWGKDEAHSNSRGARLIRKVARQSFKDAPGKGGAWYFDEAQVEELRQRIDMTEPRLRR